MKANDGVGESDEHEGSGEMEEGNGMEASVGMEEWGKDQHNKFFLSHVAIKRRAKTLLAKHQNSYKPTIYGSKEMMYMQVPVILVVLLINAVSKSKIHTFHISQYIVSQFHHCSWSSCGS